MESVIIFPFVMLLLIFFINIFNYFFVDSFINHRVDSFGSYVSSVGSGEVSFEGFSFSSTSLVGDDILRGYLLKDGFLSDDKLNILCDFSGGYFFTRVTYRVDLVFFGEVFVVNEYERRLWL